MIIFSKKAEQTISDYLAKSQTNMLTIGVIFPNGVKDFYCSENTELHTPFDVGSISKTFTAALILKLAREGKISLDARADEYIELPRGKYPKISQLLTHTAGYGHLTPLEVTLPSLIMKSYQRANPYRNADEETVIKALSRRRKCKDFYHYGYSDFPYAILAVIASKVTGKPFSEILEDFIKNDLELQHTHIAKRENREASYLK